MITINDYTVVEDSVFAGISNGVQDLLQNLENFSKPEVLVESLTNSVMAHLARVLDFSSTPVRFTPDVLLKVMEASKGQGEAKDTPPQQPKG